MPSASITTWGQAIDRVLADGLWHHRDEILEKAVAAIPPGVAYRRGDLERTRKRSTGDPTVRHRGDQSTSVAAGARDIARQALRGRVRKGTVQRDGNRFRRRVDTRSGGSR